jgi:alpha-beta hydrolase superfamily lysophospholipase
MQEMKLKSFDGKQLQTYVWDDVKKPIGVIQLVHGSCEHSLRYREFAAFFNANGYIVVAHDHRGHGQTADLTQNELGYFSDENGWDMITDDLLTINDYIRTTFKNLKIIMFSHSMGTFIARTFVAKYHNRIDGLILSGTARQSRAALKFGVWFSKRSQKKHGPKYIDKTIFNLSYAPLNKKFKFKGATGSEWIQNDQANVAAFVADPLCGFIFTNSAYKDLFTGLLFIQKKANIQAIETDLPILFASGAQDSVGNFKKGVKKTYNKFKKAGLDVTLTFYEKSRHEIGFDIEKEQVLHDWLAFANQITK